MSDTIPENAVMVTTTIEIGEGESAVTFSTSIMAQAHIDQTAELQCAADLAWEKTSKQVITYEKILRIREAVLRAKATAEKE